MENKILSSAAAILLSNKDFVLMRVVKETGSTPRATGAAMILLRSSEIIGTIGGGLLEASAIKAAADVFDLKKSKTFRFDMTSKQIDEVSMICGGQMEIFIEYISPTEENIKIFKSLSEENSINGKCFLLTRIDETNKEESMHILFDSRINLTGIRNEGLELLDEITDNLQLLKVSSLININGSRYWVDLIRNDSRIFLFGGGHVSKEVALLGSHLEFHIVVLDDRPEFVNEERFPKPVHTVLIDSFSDCVSGLDVDENSYIVIMTRGHKYDHDVLRQALTTSAGYIGMIASKKKKNTIYNNLIEAGVAIEELEKVYCPIGLDIDSETPEEIAVSIMGELISVRAAKRQCKN